MAAGVMLCGFCPIGAFAKIGAFDVLNPKLSNRPSLKELGPKGAVQRGDSMLDVSVESLLILASSYGAKKDYENQIRILRKITSKNKTKGEYQIQLLRALRLRYFKTKNLDHKKEVVQAVHHVLERYKKHREPAQLEMLALLQYKEGGLYNAYDVLDLFQTMVRDFGPKKMYIRGVCKYLYLNQFYQQSLKACKKASRLDPKSAGNYVYYALSLKDEEQKEKQVQKSADQFPRSFLAQSSAGETFLQQKSYKQAHFYWARAVQLRPDAAKAHLGLAQALFEMGRFRDSRPHFFKACVLDKAQVLWAFKQAKSKLNQKNKFALADDFSKSITKCFHQAG